MRYLNVAKEIEVMDGVSDVKDVKVNQNIQYSDEQERGIRVKGILDLRACIQYPDYEKLLQQTFDLDILVSRNKLENNTVSLKLERVTPIIEGTCLRFIFVFALEGVKAADDDQVIAQSSNNDMEELFDEEDERCLCYRMVIAQEHDTYESIANRYEVDVAALKEVNHNKEVIAKSVFVLPFF